MEYADSFVSDIETVDVFIFDSSDKYLFTKQYTQEQLIENKMLEFGWGLDYGIYKVLTVGGLSDQFEVTDYEEDHFIPGQTTIDNVIVYLNRRSEIVSHEFPPLWVGETATVDYHDAMITYPVHFTKDTNHFTLHLENTNPSEKTMHSSNSYTFEIISPEGAVYSAENIPLLRQTLTYQPYNLTSKTTPTPLSTGQINTCRLFNSDRYRLVIRNTQTGNIEWDYKLMSLLLYSKPENRPDGSSLPIQEYLDRESEWDITIRHKEDQGAFVAVAVEINGWIMWMHEIK